MGARKNSKTGKWDIQFSYTDYCGKRVKTTKRGFERKKDAEEYVREYLIKRQGDLKMSFERFLDLYYEDAQVHLREHTLKTKKYIIDHKILAYFSSKPINSINPRDIKLWQNALISKGYADTYLRTINNTLNTIFNFAVRYYGLKVNPCKIAGSMGKKRADQHSYIIWTKEEFLEFRDAIMDKRLSYVAFSVLYWQGIRTGELLALTKSDIDFEKSQMKITKSYQRIDRKDVITEPKTMNSKRVISIPKFLLDDLRDYVETMYGITDTDRLFPVTKGYLQQEMKRGCKKSGVKKIKVHGLRHSAVSFLISNMEVFDPLLIAERMGHSVEECLSTYSHLYGDRRNIIANRLDELYGKDDR